MGMEYQLNLTKEGRAYFTGGRTKITERTGRLSLRQGASGELCCCGPYNTDWVLSLGMVLKSTQNRSPIDG